MSELERDRRALELFQSALDRPEAERVDWLSEQTDGDPELLHQVESLLEAHRLTGGILDAEPFSLDQATPSEEDIEPRLREGLADRYEILEELGRGGMALVFKAHEIKHDRMVVIKALKPGVAYLAGPERFEREVKLAAQLAHPHILGLIDSGVEKGVLYYVMPFSSGETLRHRLEREGALPLSEARPLLIDIADAMSYAHGSGVVHRDLKPGNILCVGSHAYLMDFGIAKSLYAESQRITQVGHALGTPRYMAPEQASGDPDADHRVDIYAWGLLAFEMLTGESARKKGVIPDSDSLKARLEDVTPPLPADLIQFIDRCLEPDPDERVVDADEILMQFQAEPSVQRRSKAWTGWVAAAAAAGIALVTWLTSGTPTVDAGPRPIAVAPFVNETGDASLDPLGSMAGDWISQGLQQVGDTPVLPWQAVLETARRAEEEGVTDLVQYLADETGAGTVVTGSFYSVGGDELTFGAVVADVDRAGALVYPQPISAPRDRPEEAIIMLRDRIMGSMAVASDPRLSAVPFSIEPPTFDAYRIFDRGLRLYLEQDYSAASLEFADAFAQDTTFLVSLLYEATTRFNTGDLVAVDSILSFLAPRRERLGEYQENRWEFLDALLEGDGQRSLRLARRGFELGPVSRAGYNFSLVAMELNRPAQALDVLSRIDPDRGSMRGWAQYWTQLSHASHLLGDFEGEFNAATQMRTQYPERRVASVFQSRALAAQGDEEGLATLLEGISALSPQTYWSYGAALVTAGEEMMAHGSGDGVTYLERGRDWLLSQLETNPGDRPHRYWLGSAYYGLQMWDEARRVFEELVLDFPERANYRGLAAVAIAQTGDADSALVMLGDRPRYEPGAHLAYRARVESIVGDPDRAIDMLSEALDLGVDGFPWLHGSAHHDLWSLDNPRLDQLLALATEMN